MPVVEPPMGGGPQVAEQDAVESDRDILIAEAILLTRLPDQELDQLIIDRARTSFGLTRFAAHAVTKMRMWSPVNVFLHYRRIKNAIIALPGRGAGLVVRWGSRDGGHGFCVRIRYCKRKSRIRDQLDAIGEAFDDATALKEVLEQKAPDLLEVSRELAEEIGDIVGDFLMVPLLAKALLYGLDDICPCCGKCGGRGKTKAGKDCTKCEATGQEKPDS